MQKLARGVLAVVVMSVTACGDDGADAPADASIDEAPAVRCDPTKPFGPPTFLTELATDRAENGARLYDDERTILFSRRSASTNLFDLYTATRASIDEPFGSPTPLATVNSVSNDSWASMTPDGLTLVYDTDRTTGMSRPWISRRTAATDPWGPPMFIPELAVGDVRPLLVNATSVYFVSSLRGGAGKNELLRADVSATGSLGTPVLLAGTVNSAEAEETPTLTADELAIFFRRETTTVDMTDPMNPITTIEYDIWGATRGAATEDFGPPAQVESLSLVGSIETPSWISADGCALYGSVDDAMDLGGGDLVVAKRPL